MVFAAEERFRSTLSGPKPMAACSARPNRTFAKYDYWSKVSFLSFDEFLWLSVGLQPLPEFIRALDRPLQGTTQRDVVVEHMVAQRKLFSCGFDANGHARLKTAQTFLDWANLVQHELHPSFRRMLEKMVEREPLPDVATTSTVTPLDVAAVDAVGQQGLSVPITAPFGRPIRPPFLGCRACWAFRLAVCVAGSVSVCRRWSPN